jgi:nitrate/TMAO reductase-like tetraheme cytochrome c subunit
MSTPEPVPTQKESFWSRLWRRPKSRWLLGIPIGGFACLFIGAILLGTTNWIVHKSSSNDFCFGCHSHEMFIKPEYEASSHFKNAAGVQVMCKSCHLPEDNWFELMVTKVVVSADIIPELRGKIDTKEKYEAHRGEMAATVWAEMLADDSRFCRSCHSFAQMNTEAQNSMAKRMHPKAAQSGQTCIECHRGIVHALPENEEELWEQVLVKAGKSEPAEPDESDEATEPAEPAAAAEPAAEAAKPAE